MTTEDVIKKDLSDIHGRLLDHKPLLRGEITFFVKEFEENRAGREESYMRKSVDYAKELTERLIPSSRDEAETHVTSLKTAVDQALEMCNSVLELDKQTAGESWLLGQREARVKEWSSFMDCMCEQSAAVDADHQDQIERLEKYYEELESKLSLTPPQPGTGTELRQ